MSAMWPKIIGWHVANLPAICGLDPSEVFDGIPVSGDNPVTYITVGYTGTGDTSGESVQSYADDGTGILEDGHILCDVVANSGDTDLATVRAAAFAITDAWDAALRADRTLGGLMESNNTIGLTVTPLAIQNQQGSAVSLLVTVTYHCETWA